MKKVIYIWLVIQCMISPLKAQEGFIQAYNLNETGMTFHNLLLEDDNLIICGSILKEDQSQWGFLFCKMDTLGNILEYKVHYDSLGDSYQFEQGYEIIKTTDGGYAAVGKLQIRKNPVLFKLDATGHLDFVKEYQDNIALQSHHWNIVEFEQGYITSGVKTQPIDFRWDAFVMRIDKQGNKIWELNYGEPNLWDRFTGLSKLNENDFLITGATSLGSDAVTSMEELWSIPKVVRFDSLGNIISEWAGTQTFEGNSSASFQQLFPSQDGNWVNLGYRTIVPSPSEIKQHGEIVKRDTNYNVLWTALFGEPTSFDNRFIDLVATPDNGWVAAGQYVVNLSFIEPPFGYQGGWLAKVNANGDSLWSRVDTVFYHPQFGSENFLSGVIALPSGSIIACGYLNRYAPSPPASFGWVIKVDKNGCMIPGCNPALDAVNLTSLINDFMIYPNPTSDLIHIKGKNDFSLRLYDNNGKVVIQKEKNYQESELDVRNLPSGIYFLQIKNDNRMLTKKIVKL